MVAEKLYWRPCRINVVYGFTQCFPLYNLLYYDVGVSKII